MEDNKEEEKGKAKYSFSLFLVSPTGNKTKKMYFFVLSNNYRLFNFVKCCLEFYEFKRNATLQKPKELIKTNIIERKQLDLIFLQEKVKRYLIENKDREIIDIYIELEKKKKRLPEEEIIYIYLKKERKKTKC